MASRRQVRIWVDVSTDMTDEELDSLAEGTKVSIQEYAGEALMHDGPWPEGDPREDAFNKRYAECVETQAKGWHLA